MNSPLRPLNLDQREQILIHLRLGADLSTVGNLAGVTFARLKLEMKRDPDFAEAVAKAEARVEIKQMHNVNKAAEDEKNWRASVWWLERRDRIRRGADGELSDANVLELIDELARVIVAEVRDDELQRRIIEQLLEAFERCRRPGGELLLAPPVAAELALAGPDEQASTAAAAEKSHDAGTQP